MSEKVDLSAKSLFADVERKTAGKTQRLKVLNNGDFLAVLAVREDKSTSMTVLEVPKADVEAVCQALRRAAGLVNPEEVTVNLKDNMDDEKPDLPVRVAFSPNGIGIHFKGYGDLGTTNPHGEPVFIEVRDGVPHVCIWDDITQEDTSHVISLAGAALSKRPKHRKYDEAATSLEDTGEYMYRAYTILPAMPAGYKIQGEDVEFETLTEALEQIDAWKD